jgi:cephalosporin hydroxylase
VGLTKFSKRLSKFAGLTYPAVQSRRKSAVINAFTMLWYDGGLVFAPTYQGVPVYKAPTDLWTYQELIYRVRPDLIIETGTLYGGSALFFAHQLELLNNGRVISIDIEPKADLPSHDRIRYVTASSTDPVSIALAGRASSEVKKVMVVLDSNHERDHVAAEMEAYGDMVTPGSYLIVEDTIVNGHPVYRDFGPGPMEAVNEFLSRRVDFDLDRSCEKYLLTQNPRGFLRRHSVAEPIGVGDGEGSG